MHSSERIGAVVLAAGRSKRFRSARSKLVHPLAERPIIGWVMRALEAVDVAPVVVVVAPEADEVRATCPADARFVVQREPRGTGDAVLAAEPALQDFDGSLILLYGDLPRLRAETLQRLIGAHRAAGSALSLLTATVADPQGWGRIIRSQGMVSAIVEQRDCTPAQDAVCEVNVGVYCARAPLLFRLLSSATADNAQGEIYLTDIVTRAVEAGVAVTDVPVDAAEVAQINARGELATMEKVLRAEINARWMEAGVTLQDPDTAYIGPEVSIGPDTVIGPNVHLRGRTVIGSACRFDGTAFITDTVIGDQVHLRFGVVITEATLGARCEIGPFANLRPKTVLADGVKIGNFVETKNSALGHGTKANHLAYLGDADIGAESNIGAGTITCNYDGFEKHRTVVGARVQVGSDSTLVAPVRIGDDAYVATATTVRTNVSAGALVFNPREQEERPGWVAKFRARKTGGKTKAPAARRVKKIKPQTRKAARRVKRRAR